MGVIEVGAAVPYILTNKVIRKVLILDIGVCIMEVKRGRRRLLRFLGYGYLTSQYCKTAATFRYARSGGLSGFPGVFM
jgi:hypothetical protein